MKHGVPLMDESSLQITSDSPSEPPWRGEFRPLLVQIPRSSSVLVKRSSRLDGFILERGSGVHGLKRKEGQRDAKRHMDESIYMRMDGGGEVHILQCFLKKVLHSPALGSLILLTARQWGCFVPSFDPRRLTMRLVCKQLCWFAVHRLLSLQITYANGNGTAAVTPVLEIPPLHAGRSTEKQMDDVVQRNLLA